MLFVTQVCCHSQCSAISYTTPPQGMVWPRVAKEWRLWNAGKGLVSLIFLPWGKSLSRIGLRLSRLVPHICSNEHEHLHELLAGQGGGVIHQHAEVPCVLIVEGVWPPGPLWPRNGWVLCRCAWTRWRPAWGLWCGGWCWLILVMAIIWWLVVMTTCRTCYLTIGPASTGWLGAYTGGSSTCTGVGGWPYATSPFCWG